MRPAEAADTPAAPPAVVEPAPTPAPPAAEETAALEPDGHGSCNQEEQVQQQIAELQRRLAAAEAESDAIWLKAAAREQRLQEQLAAERQKRLAIEQDHASERALLKTAVVEQRLLLANLERRVAQSSATPPRSPTLSPVMISPTTPFPGPLICGGIDALGLSGLDDEDEDEAVAT